MTEVTIEKNIPVPVTNTFKYPFEEMEVGDSFLISGDEAVRKLRSAAAYHSRRSEAKYSVRSVSEGDSVGVRCWRIA